MSAPVFCYQCGEEIEEDASPGVWVHCDVDEDGDGFDADADHVAVPAREEASMPDR